MTHDIFCKRMSEVHPNIQVIDKYVNSNKDVEIPTSVKDKVIVTSLRVVELAERGINVPFYDIVEMKKILLEN